MLYFSYGSNMSIKRLKDRVPSASFKSVATLYEHDLRFHKKSKDDSGKCDALETKNPEDTVIGVVFEIAETDKPALDKKEGLGYGYEEKVVTLSTEVGTTISAVTYYAKNIDTNLKPYHWYKHHVLTGAKENKLPDSYIKKIEGMESIPDPKPDRHQREMEVYANK